VPAMGFSGITLIAGAVGGLVSALVFYPLEVVEARQQVDQRLGKMRMMAAFWFLLKSEGPSGVYVGWQATISGVAVNWSLYFSIYEFLREQASSTIAAQMLVGIVTGVVCCVIVNPFWVMKYRLVAAQVQQSVLAKEKRQIVSASETLANIVQNEGIGQLWSGVGPSAFGSLCGAIQFLLHNWFKEQEFVAGRVGVQLAFLVFFSGCLSSLIATVLTFPYQVVRGRIQALKGDDKPKSVVKFIQDIHQKEGTMAFYAGLETNLVRQIPTSGVMIAVKEMTFRFLSTFAGAVASPV